MSRAFIRYGILVLVSFSLLYYVFHYRFHVINLWAFLLSINIISVLSYGFDKLFARLGWLRMPEMLLYLEAFLGGVPGAILGQQLFWHKTTKRAFQVVFWLIFVLQMVVLYIVMYTDLLKTLF